MFLAPLRILIVYKEKLSKDPNDLSFRAGDVFEVVTETNADWWTGRHNGRQGLFPSNYVEKTGEYRFSSNPNEKQDFSANQDSAVQHPSPQYQPPIGPPMGFQSLPMVYNPYPVGPPVQQPPPPDQQPPKKSRFGGMGNTLAQSAVGGVGFGAGAFIYATAALVSILTPKRLCCR